MSLDAVLEQGILNPFSAWVNTQLRITWYVSKSARSLSSLSLMLRDASGQGSFRQHGSSAFLGLRLIREQKHDAVRSGAVESNGIPLGAV